MKKVELTLFTLIITVINMPLFFSSCNIVIMTYSSDAVRSGEIWRLFTHPFAHNSIYHMLIDASAFIMLYYQLQTSSAIKRLLYVLVCGLFSFTAINIQLIQLGINSYCGLSGIAHGLMTILTLEILYHDEKSQKTGIIILAILFSKCLYESISGQILFEQFHFGYVGIPVTSSHTGGMIGGIIGFYLMNLKTLNESNSTEKQDKLKMKSQLSTYR